MIYLFNFKEKLAGVIKSDDIIEAKESEELNSLVSFNGVFSLSVYNKFKNISYVGHKDVYNPSFFQIYRIVNINVGLDSFEVSAIHVFFDDMKSYGYIRDKKPRDVKASAALSMVLSGSRWECGVVNDSSLKSFNIYDSSRLDAISEIIKVYGMELSFRIEIVKNKISKRYVDLVNKRGKRTGKRLFYGENALEVIKESNFSDIFTRIIPRGKGEEKFDSETGEKTGGYGRRIQITDVVWSKSKGDPIDKPKGQEYLELKELSKIYGFSDNSPKSRVVIFDDITDPNELIKKAYEVLKVNSRPLVTFKSKVKDIGRIDLGDEVAIIRSNPDIRYKTRVYKIERDLLNDFETSVELGDVVISSYSKVIKEIKDGLKNLSSSFLENTEIVDKSSSYIKGVQKSLQYGFLNTDGFNYELKKNNPWHLPAGFYSFDRAIDDNPTKVIAISAGTLAIANKKDNQGNFEFSTFGTGDGFSADVITTGLLKGGNVKLNLEDGTFLLGKDTDDYKLFFDGSNLSLNANIDISSNPGVIDLKNKVDTFITDANAKMNGLTSKQQEDVLNLMNTIKLLEQVMGENMQGSSETLNYIQTKINDFQMGLDGGTFSINQLKDILNSYIKNLPANIRAQLEEDPIIKQVKKNFKFSNDGLRIGADDSQYHILLDNESLKFFQGQNEVAYINSSRLFINEAEFINSWRLSHLMASYYKESDGDDYVFFSRID